MPTDVITGITFRELYRAAARTILEVNAAFVDSAEPDPERVDAVLQERFYLYLNELRRPLGDLGEDAEDQPDDRRVLMILDAGVGMTVADLIEHLSGFANDRERFSGIVAALMPSDPIPPAPVLEQARANAAARVAFLNEFPTLSSGEIADLYGSGAQNRAALAQRWRKQRRIFAVSTASGLRFPFFQFTAEGQPKPQLQPILRELDRAGAHDWEIALWFSSALASLDGARPVDVLDEQPERVETAAAQLSAIPY